MSANILPNRSDPEELIGEWVNINDLNADENAAVLTELDVDPRTFNEDLPEYTPYYLSLTAERDTPYDMLWIGGGRYDVDKYLVLPRTSWSEKVCMCDTPE